MSQNQTPLMYAFQQRLEVARHALDGFPVVQISVVLEVHQQPFAALEPGHEALDAATLRVAAL